MTSLYDLAGEWRRMAFSRVILVVFLVVATGSQAWGAAGFEGLGYFDANDISGDGSTLVGRVNSIAARWQRPASVQLLGDIPGGPECSYPMGVSYDGATIVGSGRYDSYVHVDPVFGDSWVVDLDEAFVWTEANGMLGIGDLPSGELATDSFANGVSADGTVVVGTATVEGSSQAFRWTADSGMEFIEDISGDVVSRVCVADDGVGLLAKTYSYWYISDSDDWLMLTDPDGSNLEGGDGKLLGGGDVVVGEKYVLFHGGAHAYRWSRTDGLSFPFYAPVAGVYSSIADGTPDGSVLVGYMTTEDDESEHRAAMIWDSVNGPMRIQTVLEQAGCPGLAGWFLTKAYAICDEGQTVVGIGRNPQGDMETWVATLPSGFMLWAEAGTDQMVNVQDGCTVATVSLDGSGSATRGGATITDYIWSEDGQVLATGVTPEVSFAIGDHIVALRVVDDSGSVATDTVTIRVLSKRGDCNADGKVDLEDFVILKINFGRFDAMPQDGDFDGDGDVDLHDFIILKDNFGT